jgi:hypothetical protein
MHRTVVLLCSLSMSTFVHGGVSKFSIILPPVSHLFSLFDAHPHPYTQGSTHIFVKNSSLLSLSKNI